MRKLAMILLGVLMWQTAMAKDALPFVGGRYFNLAGGNGTEQTISIDKSGNTLIELHGKFGSGVVYRGKYKAIMCDEYGECYKIIAKDKIASVDKDGKIQMNCRADDEPCVAPLYKY